MFRSSLFVLLALTTACVAGPFLARIRLAPRCVGPSCQLRQEEIPSPGDPNDVSDDLLPSGKTESVSKSTTCGENCQPEIVQPAPKYDPAKILNFGVDWEKIEPHKISLTGRDITCERAIETIQKNVPNDRNKIRLVVIGSKADRDRVKTDWDAADQSIRDRVTPWYCGADHWSLRDNLSGELRFKTDVSPTVYVLSQDGESLGRIDGWKGADDVNAIRRGIKKYDAAKDSDLRRPDPPKLDDAKKSPVPPTQSTFSWTAFAVGAGVALLFTMKKGQTP